MSQPTEIHTLAGAYALDALSELERAGFARHLAGCSACAMEVAELAETASRLGAAVPGEAPGPRLRAAVLAEVARTRQSSDGRSRQASHGVVAGRWRWRQRATASVAASVAAGLIAVGVPVAVWTVQEQRLDDARQQAQVLQADQSRLGAVLAAPDVRVQSARVSGGGDLTVAVSRSLDDGVILVTDLPTPPAGKAYQVWRSANSSPTSVGVMPAGAGSGTLVTAVGSADWVGVTIEPAGGSPAPTSSPVGSITLA